jgi:hypothetical protein
MKKVAGWCAALMFIGLIIWHSDFADDRYSRKADKAIEAVVDACATGSRAEYARRLVDAQIVFREAPMSIRGELPARLDNRLRQIGCAQ